jgi:hypothetical protein
MAAAAVIRLAEDPTTASQWDDPPPPRFEEQELDILAFEFWQRASCPESPVGEDWLGEEEALRCHASCL